eukprot:TRINITY_DN18524_c0_g1_i1.p1 TRINITY_DN18524_c0_g1~~TRINITY_DN18524_c0_g1_i1.p1  ORF type:complete len:240 (-),score=31.16 TRINITY_DN18524_c0_g1_i1:218-937(-)
MSLFLKQAVRERLLVEQLAQFTYLAFNRLGSPNLLQNFAIRWFNTSSVGRFAEEIFGSMSGQSFRQSIGLEAEIDFMEAIRGGKVQVEVGGISDAGLPPQVWQIDVPPGAKDGTRLYTKPPFLRGRNLDVQVKLKVRPHPVFQRIGDDILIVNEISFVTAILGGKTIVTTVWGKKLEVTIPPMVQNGKRLEIPGMGAPIEGSKAQKGSMLIEIRVVLPKKINEHQRRLLEMFREEELKG